jgi:hypothetical protein
MLLTNTILALSFLQYIQIPFIVVAWSDNTIKKLKFNKISFFHVFPIVKNIEQINSQLSQWRCIERFF